MSFPKPYADAAAKLRVPAGFVLAVAFLWMAEPSMPSLAVGLAVSVVGLVIRAWAAGHLEKNTALTDSGPYAWVRNPLYIGTLTVAAGLAAAARRWELGALAAAFFALIYLPVVELEEQYLRELFPAFPEYAGRVPRLLPRAPQHAGTKHFRWSLYRHNREYEALLGFLAGVAVLLWKTFG